MPQPHSPLLAMSQLSPCGYGERDRGTVVQSEVRKGVSGARDGVSASLGSTAVMRLNPRERSFPERALQPNAVSTWHRPRENSVSLRQHSVRR